MNDQFSFNLQDGLGSYKSSGNLRKELFQLEKEEIIDLLMEQIDENKVLKYKVMSFQQKKQMINSTPDSFESFRGKNALRQKSCNMDDKEEKYQQLCTYMQEYIENTNQAQSQFLALIQSLKTESQSFQAENSQLKIQIQKLNQQILNRKQKTQTYSQLQESLSHYIQINNNNAIKYEKLKRAYDLKESEYEKVQKILKENEQKLDNWKKAEQNQQNKLIVLEIHNRQLKENIRNLEVMMEKKSQKIRKLLEQIEKLSEERWSYKQMFLKMKSHYSTSQIRMPKDQSHESSLG